MEEILDIISDYFLESIALVAFVSIILDSLSKVIKSLFTSKVIYKCKGCKTKRTKRFMDVTEMKDLDGVGEKR